MKYQVIGNFEGMISLQYAPNDLLCVADLTGAVLTEKQVVWICRNLPGRCDQLGQFAADLKGSYTEQLEEVTFAQFYDKYGVKEGRKRAEGVWDRMAKAERLKAYNYIPVIRSKKTISGQAMPHPVTYLNQQRWND